MRANGFFRRRRGNGLSCALAALLSVAAVPARADVPAEVLQAEQQRIDAIAKAKRSAVAVFSRGGRGGGSGVVVTKDGYALTNFHVVKPAGNHMKCSMPDGRLYDAVLVSVDPTGDVAMIKLLGRDDFPAAELGDSDALQVGDSCFAVGNPFLLATDFQPTVTYGIVSGVHRYQYPAGTLLEYADCIQTDASINPGNSGGPLFNSRGQLVGINGRGSFEKRGRVNVGVGYAISINQIKHFMGYLRSGRIVDHATLGASMSSDEEGRVIVSNILESSDAYRRGLRYGDELIAFGGRKITTTNGFKNTLGIYPRGWRVPLSFRRDGKRFDTAVRLAGVHSPTELASKVQRPRRPQGPQPKPKPDPNDPENPQPAPQPRRIKAKPAAPATPPEIAKLLEMRSGYANYYFNRLNRDRVWNAYQAVTGSFNDAGGVWKLTGEMNERPVDIELGPKQATGSFPVGPAKVDLSADLGGQLGPDGSGGLLAALHCWKRLLTLGPQKFGEVYYLGTMPLVGQDGMFDVLVGTYDVVECRFFFAPDSGRLVAIEMYSDPGADPCELRLIGSQEIDGRQLPERIVVQHGDAAFGEILWKSLQIQTNEGT